jgi:hypothetical protein
MTPLHQASLNHLDVSDAGTDASTARPAPAGSGSPRVGWAFGHPVGLSRPCPVPPQREAAIPAPGALQEQFVSAALASVADTLDVGAEVCAALTTIAAHALHAAARHTLPPAGEVPHRVWVRFEALHRAEAVETHPGL